MDNAIYKLLDDVNDFLDDNTSYVIVEEIDALEDNFAYVRYYPADYKLQNKAFDFERELQRMYPMFLIKFGYEGDDVLTLDVH